MASRILASPYIIDEVEDRVNAFIADRGIACQSLALPNLSQSDECIGEATREYIYSIPILFNFIEFTIT